MSVLTQQRAASVPSGTSRAIRRLGGLLGWERWGVRFAAGCGAGLAGAVAGGWGLAALFAGAGLLLGGAGVAGAALGQLLVAWAFQGGLAAALGQSAAGVTLGLAGYLIFRTVPEVGRGLPDLRSYLWLLAGALLGGLLGGLPIALAERVAARPGAPWGLYWTWVAASLMGAMLVVPPVLLTVDRYLRRWILPIPRELPARSSRRLSLAPAAIEPVGNETVRLAPARRKLNLRQELLAGAGLVLGMTFVAVPVASFVPVGGPWVLLVYLVPILWAALGYGLRGGVLAASASGCAYLLGISWVAVVRGVAAGPDPWLQSAPLLMLSLAGAFVGESREREVRLREELTDANRLLRRDLLHVTQALTQAVEAKDAYTEGHLHRVSEYAVAVGARLGLRGQDLEMLHYASLLHDLGKIGIPEHVLRKEGPLEPHEAEVMRRHPEIGARILERLDLLKGAAPIVLCHQERYDGRLNGEYPGYPRGLAGDSIPLGARIVAVVDAFDAMTTDRPYRTALSYREAVAVLQRERGRQFDPKVVDAFLQVLGERPWA